MGQNKRKADSLINVLPSLQDDDKKVRALTDISYHLQNSDPSAALDYGKKAEELALKLGDSVGLANSYENFGMIYEGKGAFGEALKWYEKSLGILQRAGGKGAASVIHNIGVVYLYQSDYQKALENFLEAARLNNASKNDLGLTQNYNNIGLIHQYMKDYANAEKYFKMCMDLALSRKDSVNYAFAIGNLALNYYYNSNFDKYFELSERAVKVFNDIGDKVQTGNILTNTGAVYNEKGDFAKARDYFQRAANVYKELGDMRAYGAALNNIGESYISEKKYKEAWPFSTEGLKWAKETGSKRDQVFSYTSLVKIYKGQGDYPSALEAQSNLMALNDSILNESRVKEMADLSSRFDLEKKQQEIEFLSKEKLLSEETITQQGRANILLLIGIGLFVVLLGFVFYRLRERRAANLLLEEKNKIIEEKNKDITDSINYARRIQSAIQPPMETLKELFPNSFMIQLPRDIVSGDFFWIYHQRDRIIVAVADCTGHGVPGALMSMVGLNFLDETVKEHPSDSPDVILNKLHKKVVEALNKDVSHRSSMDGMDVALVSVRPSSGELQFAGAVRPLVLIRSGRAETFKGDRYSVGGVKDLDTPFTLHQTILEKGDSFFMFSDGFADQFGGPDGKKFMVKKFSQLLESTSSLPMETREKELLKAFREWKGERGQTDDVLVIGVSI